MTLKLQDSQYVNGVDKEDWYNISLYCQAVDRVNQEIKNNKIDFFSLGGETKQIFDTLIWYQIDSTRGAKSKVVNKATFFTSHYIGYYSTNIDNETIDIKIEPRFGKKVLDYLISYAYGIYLPKGMSSSSSKKSNSLWLIALMWKATLNRAITKSQIPKAYQKEQKNIDTFKGQLNISKHIQHNLFDKSKFYCNYRKLTMDTVINQTIRYTYYLLEKQGFGNLLKDTAEYDLMLSSFGVQRRTVPLHKIQNIRYSKLNIYYKKVMELSGLIIKSQSKTSDITSNSNDGFSYFVDIAQLWEEYLLKVLQRNLPQYEIYSPNERGGMNLFEDGSREIRPDIIIEKDSKVIAVLDAKYKWYKKIGKYADIDNSVSREDLYQMATYLYHYSQENEKILGLFISPTNQKDEDIKTKVLSHNSHHQIGVINLDIEQFNHDNSTSDEQVEFSKEEIQKEEQKFIAKIKGLL